MRWFVALLSIGLTACGGQRSTAPTNPSPTSAPTPPIQPTAYTISGTLTSTNGGQPIAAGLDFTAASTTSDSAGRFIVNVPLDAPTLALTISGAGLITRRMYVAPRTRTLNLDAIAATGFDLNFYRQLVRNTFDAPTAMQPLHRWTTAPNIYIASVDDAGSTIDAKTLDTTDSTIVAAVQFWTGGAYTPTATRVGGPRENQAGWISVRWSHGFVNGPDPMVKYCGFADIAKEGGLISLAYAASGCRCPGGPEINPRTVKHEVGHAMGFWHTDSPNDIMFHSSGSACDGALSTREVVHAAIAYKRARGNTDPDNDPAFAVNLTSMRVP